MDRPWDIAGVEAKLQRANENIVNLEREIDAILGADRNRVVSDENQEAVKAFLDGHLAVRAPLRVSVLAAECIHNLRSALDHLAWQLVLAGGGTPGQKTAFPLFIHDPTRDKKATARYGRCVEGMSAAAKAYILALQPYSSGKTRENHALWILHDLNITDKHHALVITKKAVRTDNTVTLIANADDGMPGADGEMPGIRLEKGKDGAVTVFASRPISDMNVKREVSIQVTFAQFGNHRLHNVIDGLWSLHKAVTRAVTELTPLR